MHKVVFNLVLGSVLLVSQVAEACDNEVVKKYVLKVSYFTPQHFCQGETKRLRVNINPAANTEQETFASIGLRIKDATGETITRFAMAEDSAKDGVSYSACIAENYLKTTDINFIVTTKKEVFSDKNGVLSRTLTVKSDVKSCNLHDFVAGAK